MGRKHHPRRGSLQFWPRKRATKSVARLRSWASSPAVKPLGFIGYKAGMAHAIVRDNGPRSLTKGEQISLATTIIECPPLFVMGLAFYTLSPFGWRKSATVLAEKLPPHLSRKIPLPKKKTKSVDEVKDFGDVRLLVSSFPPEATGAKKPKLLEMALGGSLEQKSAAAKELLGKELSITDVFGEGNFVDVHGITKGKGFQGTVKRYGIPVRQHKAEKTKRGIGTLGPWHPNRVRFSVAQSGKMGYHLRTEYNKRILKIGKDSKEVNPKSGLLQYGLVRHPYLLIKGSIVGSRKRAVALTPARRPDTRLPKEAPEMITLVH
ncbi:MAG TPA: 50S ribosomal protein L3 [Candidatus Nanoarchaeia archaeon]|nr:50S ribosomal protein L3 [Candidatus Nanoarchaeia archaeon]